jgi:hypothetical protein
VGAAWARVLMEGFASSEELEIAYAKLNLTVYFSSDAKSLRIEENRKTTIREHQCFTITKTVKTN